MSHLNKYWVEKCPNWFSKDFDWAVAYKDEGGEIMYASLHIKKEWAVDFAKQLNTYEVSK